MTQDVVVDLTAPYLTMNLEGLSGILFSPGAGLFIYVPILLTVFLSK